MIIITNCNNCTILSDNLLFFEFKLVSLKSYNQKSNKTVKNLKDIINNNQAKNIYCYSNIPKQLAKN